VKAARVELRGAGLDESPHCYKRLPDVLAARAGSIRILHTLTPMGVAMASAKEFDPYKGCVASLEMSGAGSLKAPK